MPQIEIDDDRYPELFHELSALIGEDHTFLVFEHLGGNQIYFPMLHKLEVSFRHEEIYEWYKNNNCTINATAKHFKRSRQWIYSVLKEQRKKLASTNKGKP